MCNAVLSLSPECSKGIDTIWWSNPQCIIMQCLLTYISVHFSTKCSKGMDIIWWSDPHQQRRIINSEQSMQWGWKSISSNNRRKANIQTSKREVWGNACPLVHMTPLFGPSSHTRVTSSKSTLGFQLLLPLFVPLLLPLFSSVEPHRQSSHPHQIQTPCNKTTKGFSELKWLNLPCPILKTLSPLISCVKVDTWMGDQLTQSIHFLMDNCRHHWCPAIVVLMIVSVETRVGQ